MKILHVQLFPILSGVQRVSLQEIERLNKDFDYHVIMKKSGPLSKELWKMNVPVTFISTLVRIPNPFLDAISLVLLVISVLRIKPDIIHVHSAKTGLLGRLAGYFLGKKLVYTVHGWPMNSTNISFVKRLYFKLEKSVMKITHRTICLNNRDLAIGRTMNPNGRLSLLPNGVDLTRFYQKVEVADKTKVLFMGRLDDQKDPLFFLDGIASVKNIETVSIRVVGEGILFTEVVNRIEALKTSEINISLSSWSNSPEQIYRDSDIFVMTSRYEGMPLALLEALACGLTCIVPDIPELSEIIDDGINGLVYERRNTHSLASKISSAVESLDMRETIGENARKLAMNNYNIDSRIAGLKKIYNLIAN